MHLFQTAWFTIASSHPTTRLLSMLSYANTTYKMPISSLVLAGRFLLPSHLGTAQNIANIVSYTFILSLSTKSYQPHCYSDVSRRQLCVQRASTPTKATLGVARSVQGLARNFISHFDPQGVATQHIRAILSRSACRVLDPFVVVRRAPRHFIKGCTPSA
jgi:hypothetical protein